MTNTNNTVSFDDKIEAIKEHLEHIQTRVMDDEENPELEALILNNTIKIWRIIKTIQNKENSEDSNIVSFDGYDNDQKHLVYHEIVIYYHNYRTNEFHKHLSDIGFNKCMVCHKIIQNKENSS